MSKKYCRKFHHPEYRRTNVTDDRQICDSKDPNVTYCVSKAKSRTAILRAVKNTVSRFRMRVMG